jgi:hypothetical protein
VRSVTVLPEESVSCHFTGTPWVKLASPELLGAAIVPAAASGVKKPVKLYGGTTECVRVPELPEKKASPGYVAVRVTVPASEGASEQLPAASVAVHEPPSPSVTVTLPVGTPTAGATGATAKLTVTACPVPEGAGSSPVMRVVVVPRTVRRVEPALPVWTAEPAYVTEIVRIPTAAPLTEAEQLATPAPAGASVHEAAGAKASAGVEADDARVTVPEGLDFVPAAPVSETETSAVPGAPASSGFGETETAEPVGLLLTLSVRVAVLAWKTPFAPP